LFFNRLAILASILSLPIFVWAQDPFFSSYKGLSYDNPTFVTLDDSYDRNASFTLKYRDQWRSLSNPSFTTFLLESSFEPYRSYSDNWGLGITLLNDKSNGGVLNSSLIKLHSAYKRNFGYSSRNKNTVSFGASLGYQRTNITDNSLWFGRQYDMTNLQIDRTLSSGEEFNCSGLTPY